MQLFSQNYAIILKNMHLFSKICSYLKKICNYYALMQIRIINGISIMVIFNCFPPK